MSGSCTAEQSSLTPAPYFNDEVLTLKLLLCYFQPDEGLSFEAETGQNMEMVSVNFV